MSTLKAAEELPKDGALVNARSDSNDGEYFAWLDANTALLAEYEAIRQTVDCLTCEGEGTFRRLGTFAISRASTTPCPDCEDGKIPMARLLAVGAAVFLCPLQKSGSIPADAMNAVFTRLRAMQL